MTEEEEGPDGMNEDKIPMRNKRLKRSFSGGHFFIFFPPFWHYFFAIFPFFFDIFAGVYSFFGIFRCFSYFWNVEEVNYDEDDEAQKGQSHLQIFLFCLIFFIILECLIRSLKIWSQCLL